MKKKQNNFETSGIERMTDAENGEHRHIAGRFAGDRRVYFDVYTA